MRGGTLRHRVTIEAPTEVQDASGEPDMTWSAYATRWGEIVSLTGRERFEAQQTAGEVDHEIRIRHTAGITPKMRARENGRVFDIEAAFDPTGRKRQTTILAREAV